DRCTPHLPRRADTLVRTMRNVPVALRLRFPSGGEAILLADGQYLSNRILKDTDAGVAVLPWFLDGRTPQIVLDEYHLGFGAVGCVRARAEPAGRGGLGLALPAATGRSAVGRLQRTIHDPGGPERALAAAHAVEDVWEELRPRRTHAGL